MALPTNHYEALQLSRDATPSQVRGSYHRLARELHPDRRRRHRKIRRRKNREEYAAPAMAATRSAVRALPPHGRRETRETVPPVTTTGEDNEEEFPRRASVDLLSSVVTDNEQGTERECELVDGDPVSTEDDDGETDDSFRYDANEDSEIGTENADERFRQVQDAYECLIDPQRRREYDDTLRTQEERARFRRRSAMVLDISDCRWEALEECTDTGGGNEHVALVYTCRCGEDLYPLEDYADDGDSRFLDCPGCSAVYNVSFLVDTESKGMTSM